jgi:SAM-dependent methyltransferase
MMSRKGVGEENTHRVTQVAVVAKPVAQPQGSPTQTIQRQYNEVIASHYDLDPQGVIGRSLDRAVDQFRKQHSGGNGNGRLRVLDVGMGTGLFLAKLKALVGDPVQPFGLDLSEKMVECARRRIPDLVAKVDDAANLDSCFADDFFDLACLHFITGFVPLSVLLPKIWNRLEIDGSLSFVGGTRAGFPALQARASSRMVRWLCGAGSWKVEDVVCNPADRDEVVRTIEANGFEVCTAETFEPTLEFRSLDEFLEFGYRGGWLTPFIEKTGLHRAGPITRWFMNRFVFPEKDLHSIAIVLARKKRMKDEG